MRAFVLTALIVVGLTGCREGVGSRCNSSADCHAGLVCILPIGGSPQTGGVCTDVNELGMIDLSVPGDLHAADDFSTSLDAESPSDAAL